MSIADILDKADAIRRKRKQAIALTEELRRSTFLEMFGELVTNPKGWPVKPLKHLLSMPLRNGLSPASGGIHPGRCLTLSAITRGSFDRTSAKQVAFAVEPWDDVRVDERDFLIYRENGDRALVGTGEFPDISDATTVFPDTMIAARFDEGQVYRTFISNLWKTPVIRRQLEAGARTTNGTHELDQSVIESIEIPTPDIEQQSAFDIIARHISRIHQSSSAAWIDSDQLFASLVQRAFSGDLTP